MTASTKSAAAWKHAGNIANCRGPVATSGKESLLPVKSRTADTQYQGEVMYGSQGPMHLLRDGTTVGVQPASPFTKSAAVWMEHTREASRPERRNQATQQCAGQPDSQSQAWPADSPQRPERGVQKCMQRARRLTPSRCGENVYVGVAQSGSASGLGPECRRFKSVHPHHFMPRLVSWRDSRFVVGERGSIPRRGSVLVAQLEESPDPNRVVWGSNPHQDANGDVAQLGEHRLCKPTAAGSNPAVSTNFGSVAERFIAAVLKTVEAKAPVGSNPTTSASSHLRLPQAERAGRAHRGVSPHCNATVAPRFISSPVVLTSNSAHLRGPEEAARGPRFFSL